MAQLKAAGITEDELRSSLLQEAMVSTMTSYPYSNKYSRWALKPYSHD